MEEAVLKKLTIIQSQLKAPKGQYNDFGKYYYRSCEDILEAVKPLANGLNCTITVADDILLIGDRFYIKATAVLADADTGGIVSNTAFAREPANKKGMDDSQVTGTASSYARKYALNGLFAIDDTKDADALGGQQQQQQQKQQERSGGKLSDAQVKRLFSIAKNSKKIPDNKKSDIDAFLHQLVAQRLKKDSLHDMTKAEYDKICNWLEV